jgi:hypothetical protein
MRSAGFISLSTAVASVGLVTVLAAQQSPAAKPATPAKPASVAARPAVSHPAATASTPTGAMSVTDANGLVQKYCVGCHNDRNKDRAGSLTLASFDMSKVGLHAGEHDAAAGHAASGSGRLSEFRSRARNRH